MRVVISLGEIFFLWDFRSKSRKKQEGITLKKVPILPVCSIVLIVVGSRLGITDARHECHALPFRADQVSHVGRDKLFRSTDISDRLFPILKNDPTLLKIRWASAAPEK